MRLAGTESVDQPIPADNLREAYQSARVKAGRDPDANVKLALWCEAHGLEVERLKHLSLAALADPSHALARALMGIVSEGGRWSHPDSVAARIKSNPELKALRMQYEILRNGTGATADEQWKLARWCESNGLTAEATAHDTAVTRLDPTRDAAWKKLGCHKFEGRWLTHAQVEAIKLDREAQLAADRKWRPLVEKWKVWIGKPPRKSELEAALTEVTDPRAVPSIWKVLATGNSREQGVAVQLLSQIDSTEASRGLVAIAVFGTTEEVRRKAIETLRVRDVRGALDPAIRLLRKPINYLAKPNLGPGSPGVILIEGKQVNYERIYESTVLRVPDVIAPQMVKAYILRQEQQTARDNERFLEDIATLQATNLTIEETNKRCLAALTGITGQDFGLDQQAWLGWWIDRQGYAFKPAADTTTGMTAEKPTVTEYVEPYWRPSCSCFAAGTPVQTLDGTRPIEDLRIGDRVLTQDTTNGALTYQPILAVFHNPPAETLRIRVGGETIVATGIHRFWKAGQGWTMARELKVGDTIRRLGGTARVELVEPDKKQPVFNLEVAQGTSFFVGKTGTLVHDNSLVNTVEKPFDAAPSLIKVRPIDQE